MTGARTIAAAAALALLAGCTSGGTSAPERLKPLITALIFGDDVDEDAPPPPPITRAVLDQVPFATISLQVADSAPTYVIAQEQNGPYVVFQDNFRRSVVLQDALITGTHGLGYNLSAVKVDLSDPVARRRPLARWPDRISRSYQFALRATDDYIISVDCTYEQIAAERIEIVEYFFDVVRVQETCSNGQRTFVNTHWVEPVSGRIWQTEQWLGPRIDPFIVKVIRPFS